MIGLCASCQRVHCDSMLVSLWWNVSFPATPLACCRLHGMPVAVRVVRSAAEQSKAHREVAAYERLSSSQGWLVPRLVAHGSLPDGKGHFVVTEYVEVCVRVYQCKE